MIFFFLLNDSGNYMILLWMVHTTYVLAAGINLSRTWMLGSSWFMWWNAWMHKLDLGLYSHPQEQGLESEPLLIHTEKFS